VVDLAHLELLVMAGLVVLVVVLEKLALAELEIHLLHPPPKVLLALVEVETRLVLVAVLAVRHQL
jgi:hypothetical protein